MRRLRFATLGLALLMVGFLPHQGRPAQRWALIVGVGDYTYYGDLPGARNDAQGIHQVLTQRWGFEEQNVRLLLDKQATRAAIQDGLTKWLPSVVRPGDLVVFYYAGHGGQTWDRNGDEADGLDETLCPTDVMRKSSSRDIKDDELAAWLRGVPSKNVTVILDSCHSGTATRALTPHARARTLSRSVSDLPKEGDGDEVATRSLTTRGATAGKAGMDFLGEGVLEIAAAQPDQSSMEGVFEGPNGELPRSGGAFTTPLIQYLWQVPIGTSYEEVFRLTREAMKQRGFAQDPQISVSASRRGPLFALGGGAQLATPGEAAPTAAIVAAAGATAKPMQVVALGGQGEVEISGGSSAGMTAGSLYRAGNRLLRITKLTLDRAFASIVNTRGIQVTARQDTLSVGSPVELVAYKYPATRLEVSIAEVPAATQSQLTEGLRQFPAIILHRDANALADLLIRPDGQGYVVLGKDGFVRHAVSGSGNPVAALASSLRQELGARRLAAMENPAHAAPVDFAFSGDRTSFRIGEKVHFRIRPARDGYLTIVDVDAAGKVTVIFPNAALGTDNRVRAGQEILLPGPAAGGDFEIVPPAGRGVVRAFVTERPMSIPFVEADAPQAELVAEALRQAAGQAPIPGEAVPVGNWSTASITYEILK